jgi:hypothetical protein
VVLNIKLNSVHFNNAFGLALGNRRVQQTRAWATRWAPRAGGKCAGSALLRHKKASEWKRGVRTAERICRRNS